MSIKIDTKEKFTVFTPSIAHFTANMAEELTKMLEVQLQKDTPHVIINLEHIQKMDEDALPQLVKIAELYREAMHSFVVCCLQTQPMSLIAAADLLEALNYAPTQSEAWDIVQMEEIEREFLAGDDQENLN